MINTANEQLLNTAHPGRYTTVFYGVLGYETGELNYVNAGHNPPLLRRASGEVEVLGATGTVVGILPGAKFEENSIVVGPGDVLALYTDGVTEAEDPSGEPFGELRLRDLLGRRGGESAEQVSSLVVSEVEQFSPGELSDDRTLVIGLRAT